VRLVGDHPRALLLLRYVVHEDAALFVKKTRLDPGRTAPNSALISFSFASVVRLNSFVHTLWK
jgi:hypothetical protein